MNKISKKIKVRNVIFSFTYEKFGEDYLPHIYIRHLVMPNQVVKAFFAINKNWYNDKNYRFEAYSEFDNISIYYICKNKKANDILIITAFYGEKNG